MRKYYIEVVNKETGDYVLQSTWFHSLNEAMAFAQRIEYINTSKTYVDLMCAEYDEETDEYGDIEKVKRLI